MLKAIFVSLAKKYKDSMWERMFDLVLGLKKEHRLMIVITLIYAVTLFGITVDVEAMENWLQLVGIPYVLYVLLVLYSLVCSF